MSDESFVPWEQIEPLLEEGMTGADLKRKLCALTGLDPAHYHFVTRTYPVFVMRTLAEALRDGLWAERVDRREHGPEYRYGGEQRVRDATPSTVGSGGSDAKAPDPHGASGSTP